MSMPYSALPSSTDPRTPSALRPSWRSRRSWRGHTRSAGRKRAAASFEIGAGAHRAQIGIRPDRLAFVGQDKVEHLLAVGGIRAFVDQAHHIRHHHGAFGGNHERDVGLVLVLGAISVEVVVEQDRNLARQHPRIGGLLGHDRIVLLQFREVVDALGRSCRACRPSPG